LFGCCVANLNQWERNKAFPEAPWAAKIIDYIGFNPLPTDTLGERIRGKRLELGLYQRELAKLLGVNIATLKLWELDEMRPVKHRHVLAAFLQSRVFNDLAVPVVSRRCDQ
jgi:hypothetical protein